jgi:UDP-N-acetylglucosamine diphosphorylase/glucosamine-1-phosphate N-acetyltransferase
MQSVMNCILFDRNSIDLYPLTLTRPVAELRCGILTISEKWKKYLNTAQISYLTSDYLQKKYPLESNDDNLLINASLLPTYALAEAVAKLNKGEALVLNSEVVALRIGKEDVAVFANDQLTLTNTVEYAEPVDVIRYPWDLFSLNHKAIVADFELLTKGRKSAAISDTNRVKSPENVFIEEGATVEFAILNASEGPIYVGEHAEIMEGAMVRGPLALCEGSALKMGAKIYGATTIGPHSKVGGEVHNTVITGFSNKGHDGFLGNAVLGEWCNLGADTNNSNLKNNYAEVKVWNYRNDRFIPTGLQFCGLIMGDHSKCGINTMFNTGTVVGVSSNLFGDGFPRNFVPSFAWGGAQGYSIYTLPKVYETAQKVMARRGIQLTDIDKEILAHVFAITEKYRNF